MHVFVTGATGLIGRALVHALLRRGDFVTALSRSPEAPLRLPAGVRHLEGDPAKAGRWEEELARTDACVHLAGEPIGEGRWNAEKRARIRSSRVDATRRVAEVIRAAGPKAFVSGSAVGIYGDRADEELPEDAAPGEGFLPEVCQEWEEAAAPARARARVVLLRSGIVLSRDGGALPRMALPFRLFAGGRLGDGAFWQPWIHLADEIGLILFALDGGLVRAQGQASQPAPERAGGLGGPSEPPQQDLQGPLNAVAPAPARNRELARAIGKALHRPALLPAPTFAIRLAAGAVADEILSSQRVVPRKALALGYAFRFPAVDEAVRDLLG